MAHLYFPYQPLLLTLFFSPFPHTISHNPLDSKTYHTTLSIEWYISPFLFLFPKINLTSGAM
jgi:hypothetical protein